MMASAMKKRQEKRRGTMWEQRSDNFTLTAREGLREALDRGNEGAGHTVPERSIRAVITACFRNVVASWRAVRMGDTGG